MHNLRFLVIYLSVVVGLILLILPLPDWVQIYRPDWIALILIYWSMALPKRVGLWSALVVGLFVDSLLGTLLGQHALALIVIVFINLNVYQRIRVLSLPQQALYLFGLLVISQFITAWVDGILGLSVPLRAFFGAPFIGMLMWPWVFVILRDIRRKAMLT
jgi:rod shape-determining protein MreD